MRVHVVLKQIDYNTKKEEIVKDGIGLLKDDTLVYFEDTEEKAKHEISFSNHGCKLKRNGDVTSVTNLRLNMYESSKVHSPYGVMEIASFAHSVVKKEDVWSVEYSLFQGEQEVLHQTLVFEIQPLA